MSANPLNRLDQEESPYLASLAGHPVNWYPWCRKAFSIAQERNKPVFLSVGAPWCAFTRRMDHDVLALPHVAQRLNQSFVCLKVDRDEHPEVDRRYQAATALIHGEGGYPLSAFLTPQGEVFFAATFLHAENHQPTLEDAASIETLLGLIEDSWRTNAPGLIEKARHLTEQLGTALHKEHGEPSLFWLQQAQDGLSMSFDLRHGGFFSAPKFPHTPALDYLLAEEETAPEDWRHTLLHRSLESLTQSALRDRLKGDFYRYAPDEAFSVAQGEKCLADNAALLTTLARANLCGWPLTHEMTSAANAFCQNWRQEDGLFVSAFLPAQHEAPGLAAGYSLAQIQSALVPEDFAFAQDAFGLSETGHPLLPPGQNTLALRRTLHELAVRHGLTKTQTAQRLNTLEETLSAHLPAPQTMPLVDTFCAPQAQAVTALLSAHRAQPQPLWQATALEALNGLIRRFFRAGRGFVRAVRPLPGGQSRELPGLLEDQSALLLALLAAFETTGQRAHLKVAQETWDWTLDQFQHESGLFQDTAQEDTTGPGLLSHPHLPWQDAPGPSANAQLAQGLWRLFALTAQPALAEKTARLLSACGGLLAQHPVYTGGLAEALWSFLHPPYVLVLSGEAAHPGHALLHQLALGLPWGRAVVFPLLPEQWPDLPAWLQNSPFASDGSPTLWVFRQHQLVQKISSENDFKNWAARLKTQ